MTRGALAAVGIVLVSATLGCGEQRGTGEAVESQREAQQKASWHVSPTAELPAPVVAAARGTNARAAASQSQVLVASYELGINGARVLTFARADAQYNLIDPEVRAVAPKLQVHNGEYMPGFAVASDGDSFLIVGVSVDGDELLGVSVGADGQLGEPFSVGPCSSTIPNGIALASDGTGYVAAWVDGPAFRAVHINVSTRASTPISFGAIALSSNAGYAVPSLASNGATYLLIWEDNVHPGMVNGLRLNPDGTPKDAASFQAFSGAGWPSVASDGHDFVIVGLSNTTGGVIAQRISAAGAKLGTALSIESVLYSGQAPTVAFVGSGFVTAYWDTLNGRLRSSFISHDVTTATSPTTLAPSPVYTTQVVATATPSGALLVTGPYATPVSSELELGASVLVEAKPPSRENLRSAAVGSEYLVAWQEEAPAFEAPEQRLKFVTVASSASAPEPVLGAGAFDANSGAKFGELAGVVADDNGYLFSGINGYAYVGQSPFRGFVPPGVWPWAAGHSGYLTSKYADVVTLHALDTDGNVISGNGVTPSKPCPASQLTCVPMSMAHRPGGYAVLWGTAASQTSDGERAAVTLTDEQGNVVDSKLIDAADDAGATAIVTNGVGYLVLVPEALNSTTQKWSERRVLQLDAELNVVASNATELLVEEFKAFNQRYSDIVVSGGEYYAVYDKQRWKNDELPHGPLWFAHLAGDGTIADEFQVVADTTGSPVLATAGDDSFLLTTSASEILFIRRAPAGGGAGAAGAGDVPDDDSQTVTGVSGGMSAGGADGQGEAPEDETSADADGGSDADTSEARPKAANDSSCSAARVAAPEGSSCWGLLSAIALVGLARRRRSG